MKHLNQFLIALALTWALHVGLARSADSPVDSEDSSIGYASVEDALAALKTKAGVKFRTQNGMTIAEDLGGPNPTVWIFYPKTHPAYPTVIKRYVANAADGAHMKTRVRCEASQEVCDKYFAGK